MPLRESAIKNSPLPPSVEKAYHLKCIELKRRLMEVEENNDAARLRVHRLERGISKIRVERAILLEHLRKRQQEMADLGSDGEDDQPPSPQSREPSAKRKRSSGPADRGPSGPTPETTSHNAFPTPSGPGPSQHPSSYNQAHAYPPNVYPYVPQSDALARHLSTSIPPAAQRPPFPYIHSLPNGTSVMLIAPGTPKPAPWTIQELDPRHHYSPAFETMTLGDQENEIFKREYLPFDAEGKPIILKYDDAKGKYIHVFPGSPDWKDPIVDAIRRDAKDYREPMTPTGKLIKGIGASGSRGVAQGSAPAAASAPQSEEASGPAPPVIRPRQSQSQSRGSSMNMEIAQRARREREGKEKEAQTDEQRRTSGLDTVRKDSADIKNKEDIKLERAYEDEDTGGSAKAVARFPTGGGFMAANR